MRRKRKRTAGFEDMPEHLRQREGEPRKTARARGDWLEANGLSVVDYLAWRRAQHPLAALRPPARRKLMTPEQLAELDARLEAEGYR